MSMEEIQELIISDKFIDLKLHFEIICCPKFHRWVNNNIYYHSSNNMIVTHALLNENLGTLQTYVQRDDHNALLFVAGCYLHGYLVPQDLNKSYQYVIKALEFGSISAKAHLASFYSSGLIIPKDMYQAISLCNELIDAKAMLGIKTLIQILSSSIDISKDQIISARNKAYARLIQAGNNKGIYHLARDMASDNPTFIEGTGDFSRIESLLLKAHSLNINEATGLLGSIYINKSNDPQKKEQGKNFILKAAREGVFSGLSMALIFPDLYAQIKNNLADIILTYIENFNYTMPPAKTLMNKDVANDLVALIKENIHIYAQYPKFRDALAIFGISVG